MAMLNNQMVIFMPPKKQIYGKFAYCGCFQERKFQQEWGHRPNMTKPYLFLFVWVFCAVPQEGEGSGRRSWDLLHHWHVGWVFLVGSHLMSWFVLVFPARTWKNRKISRRAEKYNIHQQNKTSRGRYVKPDVLDFNGMTERYRHKYWWIRCWSHLSFDHGISAEELDSWHLPVWWYPHFCMAPAIMRISNCW